MENGGLFLLIGFGLAAAGAGLILAQIRARTKRFAHVVEARIVRHVTQRSTTSDDNRGQTSTTSSFPVYEYQVEGRTYQTAGSAGITVFSKNRYRVGNTETVGYDPARPEKIFTRGMERSTIVMGALILLMGLVTVLGVLL